MSQTDQVLLMLKNAGARGVCSTSFLEAYIPRAAARLHDLRKMGYTIETVACPYPYHNHKTRQIAYVLRL